MVGATANVSWNSWWIVLGGMMEYVPAFTLTPRLILSLRKLYARDLRSRDGSDIDTAFSLVSTSDDATITMSVVTFADTGQNEGDRQGEGIRTGEGGMPGTGSHA